MSEEQTPETGHTPGPWEMSGQRIKLFGDSFHTIGESGGTEWFAAVGYSDRTNEMHRRCLADAKLIASAPTLKAENELLWEVLARISEPNLDTLTGDPKVLVGIIADMKRIARDTISEAKS